MLNLNFLYTATFDEFSFTKLKGELEEILSISDITPYHLQHEKIEPRIFKTYRKLRLEKSSTDGYIIILLGYARSPFRDCESYFRIVVGLDEDDIQLILKQYYSNFVTYELSPGIHTIKDIAEVVYTMGDHKQTLQIQYDDITMKSKLIIKRSVGTFGTFRFDEQSFFITSLNFSPYTPTNAFHADSPGVYTSGKFLNSSTIDKIHLKCDVFDGSLVCGKRQPILFSLVLDKPSENKVFCETETKHYKKTNKSVLNTITIFLQDFIHKEVDFIVETLTFTLRMVEIRNTKRVFKNSKQIVFVLVEDIDLLQQKFMVI